MRSAGAQQCRAGPLLWRLAMATVVVMVPINAINDTLGNDVPAETNQLGLENQTMPIFAGLDFAWQRRVLDAFETPHRLGTFGSRWDAPAQHALMSFTPGVNGDFAFPATFFHRAMGNLSALQRLNVSAQGTDRLNTSHPEAPSARVQLIVPLADDLQDAGAAHYVLNGFNLSMHCNASCGPCNSNGDWITDFNLTLGPCPRASLQASAAAAPWCAHLAVTRGWTPSHGGGKALNDCMDYRCTVDVLRLPPALIVASVSAQRQRSLFAPINVTTHSVPLVPGLCAPDPCPTAFRSLTWQLTSNQYPNRGRYLERLVFAVAPVEAAPTPNTSLHVLAGLTSPALTTYPSNYTMTYTIDVLQLGAQPVPNSIAPPLAATWVVNGTVCKNDPLSGFECAAHGLSPQLNTMVPLPSSDQHGLFAWAL